MKEQRLISIAVCTYNGGLHLEEQITSLLEQTYSNLEIVIVDDGSTDNTLEILSSFARGDGRIKVYQNELNLGYVKNFERAISLSKGDYLALCDQDDIWRTDKIELLLQSVGDAALVYHDSEFIGEDGTTLNSKMSDILNMYQGNSSLPFLFYNCISGHSLLIKADLKHNFIPLDKQFYHDRAIAFAAAENGGIVYVDKTLVKYRQHAKSDTDILKRKPGKAFSSKNKIQEIQPVWLENCYEKTTVHQKYIADLLSCFKDKDRIRSDSRVKLFILLIKNYHLLFAIKSKTFLSKINYIRKICFS